MKRLLLIVLPLLLIVGCSSTPEPINYETTLIKRDGVYYTKDTNQPYSGPVFSLNERGLNKRESILEDGKMITYTDIKWYDNGQKRLEEPWKDGKSDGLHTRWYENGQKEVERTFKNGKENGIRTSWYDNGQKESEGTFKDGNPDGLFTSWYDNGQKWNEGTFKDGKVFSKKEWNEDGSVKE